MAVEPSAVMRRQRLASGRVPAIDAKADNLPFDDHSFDASMAMVTVHHWPDIRRGLREMRRVTRDQVLIMTFDPAALNEFWNAEYFPELVAIEQARYPSIKIITEALGGRCEVLPLPIPLDCADGFQEAFYGRPEAFLDREVRRAQSAWGFLDDGMEEVLVQRLADELASGEWDVKYGHYRTQLSWTGALRLIVATP
jgi:SAM-dependent methyltransferase